VHSQTLISTGVANLDRILGGGLPLGTILLLLEDAYCPHGSTLLKYFAAEGVACGQRVLWASSSTPEAKSLPMLAKGSSAKQVSNVSLLKLSSADFQCYHNVNKCARGSYRCTRRVQEDEKQGDQEDPKLRIAWQYRRYIHRQQNKAEPAQPTCPSSFQGRKAVSNEAGAAFGTGTAGIMHADMPSLTSMLCTITLVLSV
jgi:elongator complex protein 4